MAELYTTGENRIVYRSIGFAAGLTVTAYIWNPDLVKSAEQTFKELELGLYYLDYDFAAAGTYMGVFYEGGVAKASGVFRVTEIVVDEAALTAIKGTNFDTDEHSLVKIKEYVDELESGAKPAKKATFSV